MPRYYCSKKTFNGQQNKNSPEKVDNSTVGFIIYAKNVHLDIIDECIDDELELQKNTMSLNYSSIGT